MPDRRAFRAVHTSDVHLGAYPSSFDAHWAGRRELMEDGFANVVDMANAVGADLFLICGDFFDNDRVEERVVHFAGEQIARFRGHTVLLPGNHDPMDSGRVYWRYDLEQMAPRLRIIRDHAGEVLHIEDLDLVVWGRGYLESDWHFRPLEGIPSRLDERWHIAMAHGHFVRADGDHSRSLLMHEHELVAIGSSWDYLALGHWEPHADVSAGGLTAVYSGAPIALSDTNQKAGWATVIDFGNDVISWHVERVDPREKRWDGR